MTNLPQDIKAQFFKMMEDKISILDFEQWVYDTKELESVLSSDDYFELISLNYKKSGAKYELLKVIERNVDLGEFETVKLLKLLKEAQLKNEKLPDILEQLYDLYCDGFYFLDDLGLGFGLHIAAPDIGNYDKDWNELTQLEKNTILNKISPKLDECLKRAINWIEARQIVITGDIDELGRFTFQDFRRNKEKKPLVISYQHISSETKKWWQFWK